VGKSQMLRQEKKGDDHRTNQSFRCEAGGGRSKKKVRAVKKKEGEGGDHQARR